MPFIPILAKRAKKIIKYLLRAAFDADDQAYTNGQVLDTVAEGVQDGQLTVVDVEGSKISLSSNKCAFVAQSSPTWGDLGFYSQAITRALGRGLLCIINLSTWEEMGLGWHSAAAVVDPDNMIYALQANATDGQIDIKGGVAVLTGLSLSTDYRFILVCGGYSSGEVPWYAGQTSADYLYGGALFARIGADNKLIWRDSSDNTASIYAILSSLDAVGTVDDIEIADKDLSAVLQPNNLSTFTAANGTSLDAITPEVGGAWTEQTGDWDIQSNRASMAGAGLATFDAGIADVLLTATIQTSGAFAQLAVIARYSDANNYWDIELNVYNDTLILHEINGGVNTSRANVAMTVATSTDYDIAVITDGQDITCYADGANRITYGSAALNETETEYGLRTDAATMQADNFAIYPRTSSVYDAVLDAV